MTRDLSARDTWARELMDEADADLEMLERTYERFGLVNALVSRPGLLYRRDVRLRARRGPVRILDIGAGGADACRLIARRLRRDGLTGTITALDVDPRAIDWAARHDRGAGIAYRHALSSDLVAEGAQFDVIISNHVLHHLNDAELRGVLHDSQRLLAPGGIVVHRDIARSAAAYALFAAATWPFARSLFRGSFIRVDGLISIRRSYTPRELAAIVPAGWRVRGGLPARLEARWEARATVD
ncbi:methyltransferase domain-containing protein [Microbacterium sp. 1.5R]|uniref:methyltransferase domain-containing protein n=1 Tax=Microbacterium sp. 1.5R TaxID=1916917 RepID=UPI0011AB1228|nr:methyltransferase domain-containing protein [Microbacterium sp. 1.5R]